MKKINQKKKSDYQDDCINQSENWIEASRTLRVDIGCDVAGVDPPLEFWWTPPNLRRGQKKS